MPINEFGRKEIISLKRYASRELNRGEMEFLIRNIYLSIEEELEAAAYYQALADISPNPFAREIILEFSQDEREHAYELQQTYEAFTDKNYRTPGEMEYEFEIDNYITALEERVLAETKDYKKYKEYYLMTNNLVLRDIFFNAMHDEAYHATRELYLIHMEMMRGMMMDNKHDEMLLEMRDMMSHMFNMIESIMEMMHDKNQSTQKTETAKTQKQD